MQHQEQGLSTAQAQELLQSEGEIFFPRVKSTAQPPCFFRNLKI